MPIVVRIKRGDAGPLKLEVVDGGKPGIEAYLEEIKAGEEYDLVVSLVPPMKPGQLRSWVRIKTGAADAPEKTVPVYAKIPESWAG